MAGVYDYMLNFKASGTAGYVVLIDPDRMPFDDIADRVGLISEYADLVFVGGSITDSGRRAEPARG